MKIDRLIGILSVLLQQDKVTAQSLADKFEVSLRTVYRDINTLCCAGIPIRTEQGKYGGISIMSDYKIDRTLLTSSDMQAILAGLRSLDSISGTNRYALLMEKICSDKSQFLPRDQYILIDLASWSKSALSPKIEMIHSAIEQSLSLSFLYYSPKGESNRLIQPYYLLFHWSSWYVWGKCLTRNAFRLFKLSRMMNISQCEPFQKEDVQPPSLSTEDVFPHIYHVKAVFDRKCKWRLLEEYGEDSYRERSDGRLLFEFGFTDKESIISWLLTFGDNAELLEPKELRKDLYDLSKKLMEKYNKQ